MLTGKTVLLGITGSIAAYKMPNLVRMLKKLGCNVRVLMTKNACEFITPLTLETVSQSRCLIDTFDRSFEYSVEHVALAKQADLVLIAPASANVIGKIASGIADDMLTTTVMACPCKKLIAPAMNHNMLHNPIVEDNIERLRGYGYGIIEPVSGMLANGDIGDGRMPDEAALLSRILYEIDYEKDFSGKSVLVTAGATIEAIDPVRFISNRSSGKMGVAVAKAAAMRGAEVTLVAGKMTVPPPDFVRVINVESAKQMYDAVTEYAKTADIVIKAAAVADYRPKTVAEQKLKKKDDELSIELERTDDILARLGNEKRAGQILCGFSMETENMLENSRKKLQKKKLDLIAANNLKTDGAGFSVDTNILTLITENGAEELPKLSKDEAAHRLLDKIATLL